MGTCCNNDGNKNNNNTNNPITSNPSKKTSQTPKKINQQTPKITAEQVDNEINDWVEKTKRNHKKSLSESNNNLSIRNGKNDYSYNESEITKDFCDDNNKEMLRTFSELSSTIHLTNLTKDFYMSKLKLQNLNSINNPQSFTLFNVLEELEDNLPSKNEKIAVTTQPVKIFVTNLSNRTPKMNKEISISGNKCNSKLGQIASNLNIIVNRSNFDGIANGPDNDINNMIDNDSVSKNNANEAQIYSQGISISSGNKDLFNDEELDDEGINIENVFYNIEKKTFEHYAMMKTKAISNNYLNSKEQYICGIYLSPSMSNNATKNKILYANIFDGNAIEWQIKNNNSSSTLRIFPENISLKANKLDNTSLLSALISIISCDLRMKTNLFSQIINRDSIMKIFLNGDINYITLDKYFPYMKSNDSSLLSQVSPNEISYIIHQIEKTFFIMNSYNRILNSTSSMEVYHLVGWYPESYSLKEKINKETFWSDFYTNFTQGKLMVSFGNFDNDTLNTLDKNCVYGGVYYPVIFVEKNTMTIRFKSVYGDIIPKNSKRINNDTFELSFGTACEIFSDMFFSWNPSFYINSYSLSSSYKRQNTESIPNYLNEDYCLEDNPQFIIKIPPHSEDLEIKLLLIKHINSFSTNETISYKLYKYEGYPIVYPDNPLRTFNSPKQGMTSDFFFFEPSDNDEEYVIVIMKCNCYNEDNQNDDVHFTLKLYCEKPIKVVEIPRRAKYSSLSINDIWSINYYNRQSDILYDIFLKFPEYRLSLSGKEDSNHVQIIIETKVLSNVMICLIESRENLFHVTADQFLERKSPNFFSNSFSYIECIIPNGEYLLLCLSANENDAQNSGRSRISNFSVTINSLSEHKPNISLNRLYPIPKYQNIERVFGEWTKKNNRGIASDLILLFKNPSYHFTLSQKTKCYFYLKEYHKNKTIDFTSVPHIFLTLYKIDTNNNFSLIYTGESLPCSFWGFYIENIELEAGKYVIICLNHTKCETLKFELLIHSNSKICNLKEYKFLSNRKTSYEILSKWNGNIRNTTKYRIVSFKDTLCDFEILVSNAEEKVGIGIIIVEIKGALKNEDKVYVDKKSLSEIKENVFLVKDIVLSCDKDYIFMPFSYTNRIFNVDITVNSNEDLKIKEINVNVDFM